MLSIEGLICVHMEKVCGFHTRRENFFVGRAVMTSKISCLCSACFCVTYCICVLFLLYILLGFVLSVAVVPLTYSFC
jgi:hypothetical protein